MVKESFVQKLDVKRIASASNSRNGVPLPVLPNSKSWNSKFSSMISSQMISVPYLNPSHLISLTLQSKFPILLRRKRGKHNSGRGAKEQEGRGWGGGEGEGGVEERGIR